MSLPEDLPGASYPLSQQCELAFGLGSKPCPYMQRCSKLWCTGKAKGQTLCQTRHFPWADGTSCGDGSSCLKGACVERRSLSEHRVSGLGGGGRTPGPCPGDQPRHTLLCGRNCISLLLCASMALAAVLAPS